MEVKRLLCCENIKCPTTFGGPNGEWQDTTEVSTIRDEALDMGWWMVQELSTQYMFCCEHCAELWLKARP